MINKALEKIQAFCPEFEKLGHDLVYQINEKPNGPPVGGYYKELAVCAGPKGSCTTLFHYKISPINEVTIAMGLHGIELELEKLRPKGWDIFNLTYIEEEPPEVEAIDFINQAKKVLDNLNQAYSGCWFDNYDFGELTDDEWDEVAKTNIFKIGEVEVEVSQNNEGDLMYRDFNYEELEDEVREILFGNTGPDVFELICCNIKNL